MAAKTSQAFPGSECRGTNTGEVCPDVLNNWLLVHTSAGERGRGWEEVKRRRKDKLLPGLVCPALDGSLQELGALFGADS